MIGQKIGSYTIVEKLGEGGMGVVYRATDSRLHRDVALKFIPEALAKDPQTMGRFEREAQVLASLNHPNIASIYGLEETGGQRALVMELASGEELATRIARGKIPLEEALRIALAIAEALEAAHDKGIIHRDLKPANIKLGSSTDSVTGSQVKILDFGLAKALQGDLASSSSGIDLTRSPTLSVAATQAGMILGTAGYMSPEQARAVSADRRADIWSFGVILYEMIAGRRAFSGDTVADTLAKVIEREPDFASSRRRRRPRSRGCSSAAWSRARASACRRSAMRGWCSRRRSRTWTDPCRARAPAPAESVAASTKSVRGMGLAFVPWAIAAAALAVAGYVALGGPRSGGDPRDIAADAGGRRGREAPSSISVWARASRSPRMARRWSTSRATTYNASCCSAGSIGWRPTLLNSGDSGPTAPYHPFLSPDGEWVGFVTATEMRKMQLNGGTPMKICSVSRSRGATWLPDDTIVFAPSPTAPLMRVPAAGGEPKPLTELDAARSEQTHRWPHALPDGKHVLFTAHTLQSGFDSASHRGGLRWTPESARPCTAVAGYARYVPSGHLVFVNGGTLFAAPFDLG